MLKLKQIIKKRDLLFCMFSVLLSCSSGPSRLEQALAFAGKNRIELEKTLSHYSKHPQDSLKLKAAEFLIENMPYYFSLEHDKADTFSINVYKTTVDSSCSVENAYKMVEKKYGAFSLTLFKKIYDSHVITAKYLIKNIDYSFKIWEEKSWHEHYCFEDFCEYILPYRIAYEPLEDWKESYYKTFKPVLDTLVAFRCHDPVAACQILYDSITSKNWIFFQDNPIYYVGAISLLNNRIGNCRDRAAFASFAMKALGIPGGIDCIIQYPNRMDGGHTWNFVTDTLGRCFDYTLYDQRLKSRPEFEQKKGRVFRMCFGVQPSSLPVSHENVNPPSSLSNRFLKDVTEKYSRGYTVKIKIDPQLQNSKIVYLSVFNNKKWIPLAWTKSKKKKATFYHVESDIVYLPMQYEDGKSYAVACPMVIRKNKKIHYLKPDLLQKKTLVLDRKYPIQHWWVWYKNRSLNGKFQGASRPDFRDSVTFYTIRHELDMKWHRIKINANHKYRYVRYLSGNGGGCNMAEVQFFSEKNKLLKGQIIGTEGSYYNKVELTKSAVFDKDPVTYYDAKELNGAWAGLDLGKPQEIAQINYLFRNDDNNIRIGDRYELLYWNDGKWSSLGIKKATDSNLVFDGCPANALFILHNYSRGKEERIFTYENGKQTWW